MRDARGPALDPDAPPYMNAQRARIVDESMRVANKMEASATEELDNDDVFGDLEQEEGADDNDDNEVAEQDEVGAELMDTKVKDLFGADAENFMDPARKSNFEKRQERLQTQILSIEDELVAEKTWALKGEASGKNRPMNSLLEEALDVEYALKPAPVITEESTLTLEDRIKKRIVDKLFNDVERRYETNDGAGKGFDPNAMDDEEISQKSKKGLAEVYEEEYLRTTTSSYVSEKDTQLVKTHAEIDGLFKTLCYNLDALTNYHFTPKPAAPTLEITTDVAAIEIEEKIPMHVSDATRLAPQEVYQAKDLKVRDETSKDERKRDRKKAKNVRRREAKARDEKKAVREIMTGEIQKETTQSSKEKAMKELMKQDQVTIITKDKTLLGKRKSAGGAKIVGFGGTLKKQKTVGSASSLML